MNSQFVTGIRKRHDVLGEDTPLLLRGVLRIATERWGENWDFVLAGEGAGMQVQRNGGITHSVHRCDCCGRSDRRGPAHYFPFCLQPVFEGATMPIATFGIEFIGPLGDQMPQVLVGLRQFAYAAYLGGHAFACRLSSRFLPRSRC